MSGEDTSPLSSAVPPSQPDVEKETGSSASSSRPWWQQHRENIATLLVALLLAVGLRLFVAEARWIPSDSMMPTLAVGDRLVVEKISYRFHPPERGDIIVFEPPGILEFPGAFIKRVVGLPGDRIRIQSGQVLIDGTPLQETYIAAPPDYSCPGDCPGIPILGSEFVVPEGAYFVMGDNRNDSQDSHIWGFLPEENIIGHAVCRFWPPQRLQLFSSRDYAELSAG